MNELIRKFELESHIDVYALGANRAKWESVLEKFTELIVQECMNQVRDQYLPVLEDRVMMTDTHWAGYVQCGVDSYVAIREHFGVER